MHKWRVGAALGLAIVVTSIAFPSEAVGRDKAFDLGIGYTHVELDGSASPFDSRGGIYVEPRFSWGLGGTAHGWRLGIALGISGFERENDGDDRVIIVDDDDDEIFVINADDVESLTLLTPEFQVSYRVPLGPPAGEEGERRWFVEPGVGVGVVVGQYWVGESFGWWTDTDVNEWDATFGARPFLRAGYQSDRWVLGVEGSYLFGGDLEFTDEIGGDVEEWRVGVFFGGRW